MIISSCTSTKKDPANPRAADGSTPQQNSGFTDNDTANNPILNRLPQPVVPNAESTRRMVMASNRPEDFQLMACYNETTVLARDAINDEALVLASRSLTNQVNGNPELYHWCFYYHMMRLDNDLEAENLGELLHERKAAFLKRIKVLWIMANALDQSLGTSVYFPYLRQRYIQLSRDFFARDVDTVAPR